MMKKTFVLLVLLMCVISAFSQEKITEGFFVLKHYDSNYPDSDLPNSTTYFKGNKKRAESYNAMNGETIQISDSKTKELLTLVDNPSFGKKYKLQKMIFSDEEKEKYAVTKGNKKRKILGYNCNQYLIKLSESAEFEIYSTEEINIQPNSSTDIFGDLIKGFILYTKLTSDNYGGKVEKIAEVIEIKRERVSDDKFSLVPPIGYSNN